MIKKTLVAVLTAIFCLPISAQITVSGDIKDTEGHHIKYASLRVDKKTPASLALNLSGIALKK